MPLQIKTDRIAGDRAIALRCYGDLDADTSETLDEAITSLLEKGECHIVLDLAKVRHISSPGIGVLNGARDETSRRGGGLVLLDLSEGLSQVFQILGLDDLFMFAQSEDEALQKLGMAPVYVDVAASAVCARCGSSRIGYVRPIGVRIARWLWGTPPKRRCRDCGQSFVIGERRRFARWFSR